MNGSTVIVVNGIQADPIIDAAEKYTIGWLVMMPGAIEPFIDQLRKRRPVLQKIACVGAMADLVPRQQIVELSALVKAPYFNSFESTETGAPPASGD